MKRREGAWDGMGGDFFTWRTILISKWLGSLPFISHVHGHLEGVPQPLQSPWLLTTYPSHGMILQVDGVKVGPVNSWAI